MKLEFEVCRRNRNYSERMGACLNKKAVRKKGVVPVSKRTIVTALTPRGLQARWIFAREKRQMMSRGESEKQQTEKPVISTIKQDFYSQDPCMKARGP